MQKTPPVLSHAKPLLGHALEFSKDRQGVIRRGFQELGPVFSLRLGPRKAVVIADPALGSVFFKETDKKLSMSRPYKFIRKSIGDVSLFMDHETYLNQKPVMYAPLSRERMLSYLDTFNYTIQLWLKRLGTEGTMEIRQEMMRLTQDVMGRILFGNEIHEQIEEAFWKNFYNIGRALDPVLPPNLPLPKNIKRNRSRKKISKILTPMIEERREHPERFNDRLTDFIQTRYTDGTLAEVKELLSQVIGFLFAGHETTAGQAAWTVIQLLQHPDYMNAVKAELAEKFPYGSQIDAKSLVQLKHIRWAIDETTRMRPSADLLMRMSDEAFEVGGYHIPKDWYVILGVSYIQRHPEYFTDPEQYDPYRFSPARAEQRSAKHSIAAFGGGIHKCAGLNFAVNEMITIVAHLLTEYDLELLNPTPRQISNMGTSHPEPTFIRYKKKPLSELVKKEVMEEALEAGCPHLQKLSQQEMV